MTSQKFRNGHTAFRLLTFSLSGLARLFAQGPLEAIVGRMVTTTKGNDMKKTVSLFQRNYDGDRLVRDELVPGAEWVTAGEGTATRKYDGTCCMWRDGRLWKRHELKAGKPAPEGFEAAQAPDATTGDVPGWVPVGDGPEDARHREALENGPSYAICEDGTYELCGPKVQGNPEGFDQHLLVKHGAVSLHDCPRTFNALREYLGDGAIEGVVWHHPDGRMVKIKGKDFGIKRKTPNVELTGASRNGEASG